MRFSCVLECSIRYPSLVGVPTKVPTWGGLDCWQRMRQSSIRRYHLEQQLKSPGSIRMFEQVAAAKCRSKTKDEKAVGE
jgi:hypothetical protein